MSTTWIKTALAGAALTASLVPGFAAAQYAGGTSYNRQYASQGYDGRPTPGFNPHEGLQPNGCVKLCEFDDNPCDPPSFKHADGRCTYQR